MRSYADFLTLYEYIHNENGDNCFKCPERCYEPDSPTLFFKAYESTDIVFISESPYNYSRKNSNDFVRGLNNRLIEANLKKSCRRTSGDIFEFIYYLFNPVFQGKREEDLAESFLRAVYWTHAGKKTFKPEKSLKPFAIGERLKYARQCSSRLLVKELIALEPRKVVMASAVASRVLLGRGFTDLFDQHRHKHGSLLSLRDVCKKNSLLYEAKCPHSANECPAPEKHSPSDKKP